MTPTSQQSTAAQTFESRMAEVEERLRRERTPLILTQGEVMRLLRLSRRQLFTIRRDGQLSCTRVGKDLRFYRWDIVRYLVMGEA